MLKKKSEFKRTECASLSMLTKRSSRMMMTQFPSVRNFNLNSSFFIYFFKIHFFLAKVVDLSRRK